MTRTAQRETFYAEVLKTGLERRGVQLWPATVENFQFYDPNKRIQYGHLRPSRRGGANCSAVIVRRDSPNDQRPEKWHVNINTVSNGFIVVRRWDFDPVKNQLDESLREKLVMAFHNNSASDLDPELADYVIQLGLFNKVIYS